MRALRLNEVVTGGVQLVEASAGTGKTWTIAALYVILLLERRLRAEDILVVTYTRAAAGELRERIRRRIADTLALCSGREPADELERLIVERGWNGPEHTALLTRALYGFDDASIHTIHGFCQRALTESAFDSGSLFDTEMTTDQSEITAQACDDYWRRTVMAGQGTLASWMLATGVTPEQLAAPLAGRFQDPLLRIIPDGPAPDPDEAALRCRALHRELAAAWNGSRAVVVDLLRRSGLNRTSYKDERISAAVKAMEHWCGGDGALPVPDLLALFGSAKIASAVKKGGSPPEHPFFDLCQRQLEAAGDLERALELGLADCRRELALWLRRELPRRKRALNLRSYDDLLLDLHEALHGEGGARLARSLRQRYPAALIDEFQDTDPLQWAIFGAIAADGVYPLYLVGDPKQAIYSFRGADINAYLAAARMVAAERRLTIGTNRRSSPALVAATNALFSSGRDPFLSDEIVCHPVEAGRDPAHRLLFQGEPLAAPLRFRVLRREEEGRALTRGAALPETVRDLVSRVSEMLDAGWLLENQGGRRPVTAGDIAVLVASHSQAERVQQALFEAGIPSVQHGGSTIFKSREAREILTILRAAAEPSRSALVREALLTSLLGLTADRLYAMEADGTELEAWHERFRSLREACRAGGVIALAALLLGTCGVRVSAMARPGGERRLTNIQHCFELLHQAEREQGIGIEGSCAWLERRITGRRTDDAALLRLETDAAAVQISTIHASKGLQYPVVFLPFAWSVPARGAEQILFHDDGGSLVLDLGSEQADSHARLASREQAAERARLFYVAATRAEFLCVITWGIVAGADQAPLGRILHGARYRDERSFSGISDQEVLDDIGALSAVSAQECGCAAIRGDLAGEGGHAAPAAVPAAGTLAARSPVRPVDGGWRVSSFSGMVAGSDRHDRHDRHDRVRDRDPDGSPARRPSPAPPGRGFIDFPGGTAAGTCLHGIFERLDFSSPSSDHLERVVAERLQAGGYREEWQTAVCAMASDVAAIPLVEDDPASRLCLLPPGGWLCELEFFLPVAALSQQLLSSAFDGLCPPLLHGSFGDVLDTLNLQESRGMLQGAVDMVCAYGGRYYVIDWKSNHLGEHPDDYRGERLTECMASHAYILQYHLYALALHRHLGERMAGYDYERHFGGVLYVFLRGVRTGDPRAGVYRDRPPFEFIRRMERSVLGAPRPL